MKQLPLFENKSLYVFEGPDGVGKSTLCKMLSAHLSSLGVPNKVIAFPGQSSGSLGKVVHDIHHSELKTLTENIHPTSLQILHLAAHVDQLEQHIKPALEKGVTVILDRYWWSLYAYGMVNHVPKDLLQRIINIEKSFWSSITPKKVFYITRDKVLKESDLACRLNSMYKVLIDDDKNDNIIAVENDADITATFKIITDEVLPSSNISKKSDDKCLVRKKSAKPSRLESILNPTVVYDTYWKLATKRQDVFFKRQKGERGPWTTDSILLKHKFTNAYRASDRVSQYLIKNVIYSGSQDPKELFFRILLFKFFNKIETWELLRSVFKDLTYSAFSFDAYDKVLTAAISRGDRIYSAAYIMPSGGRNSPFKKKHRMHLDLLGRMIEEHLPEKVADASSMEKAFELIKSYPSIGDFLAYQYVTDINYSVLTDFTEDEFVVPGPGAKSGIKKCFRPTSKITDAEIIRLVMEEQENEFERLGLDFKGLWGRRLQLIDCQNLFCETDKYARIAHPEIEGLSKRTRIKQKFTPSPKKIEYWFPPKWGVNDKIKNG